jgi:hypothetical protein
MGPTTDQKHLSLFSAEKILRLKPQQSDRIPAKIPLPAPEALPSSEILHPFFNHLFPSQLPNISIPAQWPNGIIAIKLFTFFGYLPFLVIYLFRFKPIIPLTPCIKYFENTNHFINNLN